jgi:hypothetical protein
VRTRIEQLADSLPPPHNEHIPPIGLGNSSLLVEQLVGILKELLLARQPGTNVLNGEAFKRALQQPLANVLKTSLGRIDSLVNSLIALKKDIDLLPASATVPDKLATAIRDAVLLTQVPDPTQAPAQSDSPNRTPEWSVGSKEHVLDEDTASFSGGAATHEAHRKFVHASLNRIASVLGSRFPFYSLSMITPLAAFLVHLSPRTAVSSLRTISDILRSITKVKRRSDKALISPVQILIALLSEPVASLCRKAAGTRAATSRSRDMVIYTQHWQRAKRGNPTACDLSALFQAAEQAGKLDLALEITKHRVNQDWRNQYSMVGNEIPARTMVAKVSKALIGENRLKEASKLLNQVLASHKDWRSDGLLWQRRLEVTLARATGNKDTSKPVS